MTDAKVELKPLDCPFCGEYPNLWSHNNQWVVDCETEDCINPGTPLLKSKENAIDVWNKRSPSPQTQKQPMHPDTIDWNDGARLAKEYLNKHIHARHDECIPRDCSNRSG